MPLPFYDVLIASKLVVFCGSAAYGYSMSLDYVKYSHMDRFVVASPSQKSRLTTNANVSKLKVNLHG